MSECVVRMEMPKNCETCRLRVNDSPTNVPNWICAINQWPTFYCKKSQNHANEDKYLHDCPIGCQLPEGHGRLIDADASFLGVIHPSEGWFANYNTTIADRIGKEDMRMVKVIVPADTEERMKTV